VLSNPSDKLAAGAGPTATCCLAIAGQHQAAGIDFQSRIQAIKSILP
jgi:hypothetical protein